MEILIVGIIMIFLFNYLNLFNFNKFVSDNKSVFNKLKEDDYEFLLVAKYGDKVDPILRYQKRVKTAIVTMLIGTIAAMTLANDINFALKLVIAFVITYLMFKDEYNRLKSFYKVHLHDINLKLPYYLKSLEILIQHYTVPVALTRSLEQAPEMFKPGLRELIASIDAGDSSVEPYMAFAKRYPVRDSMRMMRLLYRLGIGSQEMKHERLMMFSKSVSSLQNKAREVKYKERLDHMENQTMIMLVVTGFGVMLIILVSMLMMFNM